MLDQKPNFSDTEVIQIAKEYFNLEVSSIVSLPSERDQNFSIRVKENKYVLKIANFLETFENLDLQNRVIQHIKSDSTFNHPDLIETNEKTIYKFEKENKYYFIRLMTFVEGIPLALFKPLADEFCYEYGKFLAYLTNSTKDFKNFNESFKLKEFYWDIKFAPNTISKYKSLIKDLTKYSLVNYFLSMFDQIKDLLITFPSSIIHNDANDYNVIISQTKEKINFGIIDFGDMVYSHTIINLAVGIAYLILNKKDPALTLRLAVQGYNSIIKLSEAELHVLFVLIAIRLTMSVCISAHQQTIEPDNKYLIVSEKPAWEMLGILKEINPLWMEFLLRGDCGYNPSPQSALINEWIVTKSDPTSKIITISDSKLDIINLGINSPLGTLNELTDQMFKGKIIESYLNSNFKTVGIIPSHMERVDFLEPSHFFPSNDKKLFKNYSTALEIYSLENLDIYCPFEGDLFKIIISSMNLFTVVMEHKTDSGEIFYSIYSNIHLENLNLVSEGLRLSKGSKIGSIISLHSNPYPLKIQILCTDKISLLQETYLARDKQVVDTIFLKPEIFISKSKVRSKVEKLSADEIELKRKEFIGAVLSISYQKHLHIVRGSDQYLFDCNCNIYLDGVNNVAHVGHNRSSVLRALEEQGRVLNTNTRYLHENIIKLAEKLTSKLPKKLQVCFFVNSGSEANELALRLAENYTNKKDIAVLNHAYHGNTSKLIEISPYKHNGPGGKGTPDYVHILELPDSFRGKYKNNGEMYVKDAIEELKSISNLGTFIFESFPGVAGQIVLANDYLKSITGYLVEHGIICIADEVQIGLGRAGSHFWGFEEHNIIPDIVTIGKPLGNGHPLGAVITTKEISDAFNNGMEYFNTFGGNPVSCAVGLAVLEEIEFKQLQKNALTVGTYLINLLRSMQPKYKLIGDVRGIGLYLGIELIRNQETLEPAVWEASYIVERLKDMGILLSTDGPYHNVIKIKPPLVFTKENALELVNKLQIVLQDSILSQN